MDKSSDFKNGVSQKQAQLMGFSGLWGIAEDYARYSENSDFADGTTSPFPKTHDKGKMHGVWVAGCRSGMALRVWDKQQANAKESKNEQLLKHSLAFVLQNMSERTSPQDAAEYAFTIASMLKETDDNI